MPLCCELYSEYFCDVASNCLEVQLFIFFKVPILIFFLNQSTVFYEHTSYMGRNYSTFSFLHENCDLHIFQKLSFAQVFHFCEFVKVDGFSGKSTLDEVKTR